MNPEIRQRIRQAPFDRASLREIQELLPEDAILDQWLEQMAVEYAADEFVRLAITALIAGRRVDARHLVRGAKILDAIDLLPDLATKFSGDVARYLTKALQNTTFSFSGMAWALGIIITLLRERGDPIPLEIRSMASSIAHSPDLTPDALPALHGVVAQLADEELKAFLRRKYYFRDNEVIWRAKCDQAQKGFPQEIEKLKNRPVVEVVPERAEYIIAHGNKTMRRSVPRVGRNEPCHCGSGKKYKHCCSDKDRERLRDSSDIEGVTHGERLARPEFYLTADRLESLTLTDLAAVDPLQIPEELLDPFLSRFIANRDFERCADALEKRGYRADAEQLWNCVMLNAGLYGRSDIAVRLIEARRRAGFSDEDLHPWFQFLPVQDDPEASWNWISDQAHSAVAYNDPDELRDFAISVLLSRSELGILLCRGVIPLLTSRADASALLEHIEASRQGLFLTNSPEPMLEVIAKLWTSSDDFETNNELVELKQLLALRRREAAESREAQARAERQLKRQERELEQLTSRAATPEDSEVVKRLRRKLQNLQQRDKERDSEISGLQRELQHKAIAAESDRARVETTPANSTQDVEAEAEDDLILQQESEIHHPLRLIEFPNNFADRLNSVPRTIARAVLTELGRMAAAEPAAFVGAVRLKSCPSVTRQRFGPYRLLFRLRPADIQVLDLIPRSELERKVKVLATQYD